MNGSVVLPLHDQSFLYHKTAGSLLREARELKGLSQESAASHLNLMTSHIVAMECDSYNPHLEGKHFATYLKSYARLLDLNPQILLGLYQGHTDQRQLAPPPPPPAKPSAPGSGWTVRFMTVLALIGLAWLVTQRGWVSQESLQVAQTYIADRAERLLPVAHDGAVTDPQSTTQRAALDRSKPASAADVQQDESPAAEPDTLTTTLMEASSQTPIELPAPAAGGRTIDYSSAEAHLDTLIFSFNGNCWVEVYDSQQNPIVMDTKLEGETLHITGEAPFEVRVGNSRAVSLTLNGEPVYIERHPTIHSTELIVDRG